MHLVGVMHYRYKKLLYDLPSPTARGTLTLHKSISNLLISLQIVDSVGKI